MVETPVTSDSVVGVQEFELNCHAPRDNIVDHFYFVDGNGDLTTGVTGDVEITLSPVAGVFHTVQNGEFTAAKVEEETWRKPNGYGKALAVRVSFTSISGAVGFRMSITQGVS
jgi:hypothetical protein